MTMKDQYVLDTALRRIRDRLAALEVTAARERLQRSASVTYDNSSSGLTATDLQAAIDELEGLIGTPSLALDDLTDVTVPAPADGDVLTYDDYLAEWVNAAPAAGASALADLTDVDLTGLADTDLLQYDSGSGLWKPGSASGVADILDLPTAETDTTKRLAPDGAGGVAFVAGGGGTDGDANIRIYGFDDGETSKTGTWSRVALTTALIYAADLWGNTSAAQNDAMLWTRFMQAGTYTFQVRGVTNTDKPIVTVKIDGSSAGTVDYYAGLGYARKTITGIVLSSSGSHTIEVVMATKNASSSGYGMAFSDMIMYRTA